MWRHKTFRRTTLIAIACASVLFGIALVTIGLRLQGWGWALLAVLFLPLCFRKRMVAVLGAVLFGIIIGAWRGSMVATDLTKYDTYYDQKVVLSGRVTEDPTYDDKSQLDFRIDSVQIEGSQMPGQVRVKTLTFTDVYRGDIVYIKGTLRDGFGNYKAAVYYAEVEKMAINNGPIDTLRRQFAASIYTNLPDPQASLGLGFLVGIKSALPDEIASQLQVLGLTHIVVASGYNLTILVRIARRLFEKISKYQTAIVSLGLIGGFVMVTGFSPSMSRAALVTGLALWAWYYGRRIHPVVLLLFAAALTGTFNPMYVWGDIGWYLSFLAFAGVMLLAPLLQRRIFEGKEPKLLGQVVLETICAQLLTLPLILYIFGDFSVLSLVANILIVPLIPLAMVFTFIGGISGLLLPSMAPFISLPATWLLTYMTEIVRLLAQIPWSSVPFSIPLAAMIGVYMSIVIFGFILLHKTKFNYLTTSVIE